MFQALCTLFHSCDTAMFFFSSTRDNLKKNKIESKTKSFLVLYVLTIINNYISKKSKILVVVVNYMNYCLQPHTFLYHLCAYKNSLLCFIKEKRWWTILLNRCISPSQRKRRVVAFTSSTSMVPHNFSGHYVPYQWYFTGI